MSKPRARRVVSREDARPTRYAPIPERAPEAQREEPEMAEWGESKSASATDDAPVVNNPRPKPTGEVDKGDSPVNWDYIAVVPMPPEPPKLVLRAQREHRVTGEIEFKDAPEPDPEKPELPRPTAKQVWGLEPMPGAEPTPAA